MFKLRGCPKCHGDLHAGKDVHGVYLSCIQCGRYFDVVEAPGKVGGKAPAVPAAGPPVLADLELAA